MSGVMRKMARVHAPATVANLGVGYDVLGLALQGSGDLVTAAVSPGLGVSIVEITGDGGLLPRHADENTAGIAATYTLRAIGVEVGVELRLHKGLPLRSGLGSSAASAVAAAVAVNELLGRPMSRAELVEPCVRAEAEVSGWHADNVAAALFGGLVLVRSVDPVDVVQLPLPPQLRIVLATPRFELATRDARDAVPRTFPVETLVRHSANVAAFVGACFSGDLALLARSAEHDLVGPSRAPLIPGCEEVIRAARRAGALWSAISGAGPSIFAVCDSDTCVRACADAMVRAFAESGCRAEAASSRGNAAGAALR